MSTAASFNGNCKRDPRENEFEEMAALVGDQIYAATHAPDQPNPHKAKGQVGTFQDYVGLLHGTFGAPRRDLFSGRLMVRHNEEWHGVFEPCILGKLKSLCRDHAALSAGAVEDHLHRLTGDTMPELLIDVPQWDGRDRLTEIGRCLNPCNVSRVEATELIMQWGSNLWRRLEDPHHQNTALILVGEQGIGKDWLLSSLTGGLQPFVSEIVLRRYSDERDLYLTLAGAAVIQISEFERTNRLESCVLKDVITRNSVAFRAPYGRDVESRNLRCSFAGSANTSDFFHDWTGARRFCVIQLAGKPGQAIGFSYPRTPADSKQILAQYRELAKKPYQASDTTQARMRAFLTSNLPDDPEVALLLDFDAIVTERARLAGRACDPAFTNLELDETLLRLSRVHGRSVNQIRHSLKRSGRAWRTNAERGYRTLSVTEKTLGDLDVSPEVLHATGLDN